MTTPKRSNGFYYFISNNPGFLICDPECCSESNDTFDIYFNSLATNETLLHYFRLVAMYANKGIEGARWFANYLSAFSKNNDNQYEKLITNPIVRVLITDKDMLAVMKTDPKLVTAITWNKGKEIKEETRKSYSDEEKHKHQCLYGKEHPEHN